MTDGGEVVVRACPECGSSSVRARMTFPDPVRWTCNDCDAAFPEPDERPPLTEHGLRADGGVPDPVGLDLAILAVLFEGRPTGYASLRRQLESDYRREVDLEDDLNDLVDAGLVTHAPSGGFVVTPRGSDVVANILAVIARHSGLRLVDDTGQSWVKDDDGWRRATTGCAHPDDPTLDDAVRGGSE